MTERLSRRLINGDAADAAIDRAVREIMSADAAPGFRQRVLARLERDPRPVWTWGRLGLAASAAAMLLLVAIWARTGRPLEQPQSTPQHAAAGRAENQPAAQPAPLQKTPTAAPTSATVTQPARAIARRTGPSAAERRVTAASVAPAEENLERGVSNVPSTNDRPAIPPLEIRPLETPEIVVKPMTIGPIVVVPLLPPR